MPLPNLSPTHLSLTEADLRAEGKAQQETAGKAEDVKAAAMRNRAYTFAFEYAAKSGKRYAGTFTNRVPDIRTKMMIGTLRAQMTGGQPTNSLDTETFNVSLMVAHMTYSLDENRPDWAKDLRNLDDVDVVYALFEEVSSHESTFLGR